MTDEDAFLRAIDDAPGDVAPRLVYADWLDERGDPRAEFLRLSVAASSEDQPVDPRLEELRGVLDPEWVAAIASPGRFRHPSYKNVFEVAIGSLTTVYVAERVVPLPPFGPRFLLRVLRRGANTEPFLNGCRIHAALRHPNIPAVHEVDQTPMGQLFAVRQFVDGEDLSQNIGRAMRTPAEVATIVTAAASALSYCHMMGHVHGYVHPRHILLGRDGSIWLIGFGEFPSENWIGNPVHLAPEQFERNGPLSPQADVYLLAETAVWLLTGQHPFRNIPSLEMLAAKRSLRPWNDRRLAETLPAGTESILLRAMSPNPNNRHPTPVEFAATFSAAVARGTSRPWWQFW